MIFKIIAFLLLTSSAVGGEYTNLIAYDLALESLKPQEVEKIARSKCPHCKGTGKVKAGDGQTVVWRECDECYDDATNQPKPEPPKPDAKPTVEKTKDCCECGGNPCNCVDCGRKRRWLAFSAKWCGPCQQMPKQYERMKAKNYEIGDCRGHVQLIDFDESKDLVKRFGVEQLPTFILIENGKEIERLTGVQDAMTLCNKVLDIKPKSSGRLTSSELKAWCKTYTGSKAYTEGMTQKHHLTNHHGFTLDQLQGLTEDELAKVHGGAHSGVLK